MEIVDILKDALVYPAHHITSLILYIALGVVAGIVSGGTILGVAAGAASKNVFMLLGSGLIGVLIFIVVAFIISGYELDIIKYGILRSDEGPGFDFIRQFINGARLFLVRIVYYLIPIIISSILGIIFQHWLTTIISIILMVVFGLAEFMAECRLAQSEDLVHALSISDAIADISKVGIVNLLLFIILVVIIAVVLIFVLTFLVKWNSYIGGLVMGIVGVYFVFFVGRATGLLYSNV